MSLFDKECIDNVKEDDSKSILELGNRLFNRKEYEEAIEYYRLSSAMGNAEAVTKIGCLYYYGIGVEQDYSIARAYFKIGVLHEDINSLYRLGDLYINGYGVEKDERKGIEYYIEAYNLIKASEDVENYPDILLRLGVVFMEGRLLKQDLNMAENFLEIAKNGYEERMNNDDIFSNKFYKETKKYLSELKEVLNSEENDENIESYDEEDEDIGNYDNEEFDYNYEF
ncbi:MAG: sel1 repeat family protein [Clostridia bacterium]|nr:sel1 repeat family protein [Clostridia bacterium]